jgi:hypothetical protein
MATAVAEAQAAAAAHDDRSAEFVYRRIGGAVLAEPEKA